MEKKAARNAELDRIERESLFRSLKELMETKKHVTKAVLQQNLRWHEARGTKGSYVKGVKLGGKVAELRESLEHILSFAHVAEGETDTHEGNWDDWNDLDGEVDELEEEYSMQVD